MNYAFFGTPEFAAVALEELIKRKMPPALVVCNPNKPAGRKRILTAPPAKLVAQKYGITVIQPEKISAWEWVDFDFFVVAAYGKIIPKTILEHARHGALGIHPSLLPKYRGPSPIQSAMLSDDETTGVSIYVLDEKVDHGPVIAYTDTKIDKKSYAELSSELAHMGAHLIADSVEDWLSGKIEPKPQDHDRATFTSFFRTEDGLLNFNEPAQALERKVRALHDEPGTFFYHPQIKKRIKVLSANYVPALEKNEADPVGSVVRIGKHVYVRCDEGFLELIEIHPEGKKPLLAGDYFK